MDSLEPLSKTGSKEASKSTKWTNEDKSVDTRVMDAYIERFTVEAQIKQMLEREENEKIDN